MNDVRVEAATMADVNAVTDLWVDLVAGQRDHGTHLFAAENRSAVRSVIEQYVHADGVVVARSDGPEGAVVGFVMYHVQGGMYEQDVERGVVENVYVVPEARGQGVGTRLLKVAESELEGRGVDVVSLSVLADNDDARALYRDRGYRPQRISMEKSLSDEE